jgi:hypothetical protein
MSNLREIELSPALEKLAHSGVKTCRIDFAEVVHTTELKDESVITGEPLRAGETGDFSIKAFENPERAKIVIKICVGFKKFKLCLSVEF